jgi:hypothetical protein
MEGRSIKTSVIAGYILALVWWTCVEPRKPSVRIVSNPAGNRTEYLSNTSAESCRYISPLGMWCLFRTLFFCVVGIALGYGLDDGGSRVRFPGGAGNFSLHYRVQNGCGPHPASSPMGTRGSFPGGKAAGA